MPSFRRLLAWFVDRWVSELPTSIHAVGVEAERPGRIQRADGSGVIDPGGGSKLGSPRLSPAFRSHLYGSAFSVEHASFDGVTETASTYSTPMRATLTWMERNRHPLYARWLRMLGRSGGDWHSVAVVVNMPPEYAEGITRDALTLCWKSFRDQPTSKERVA